MQSAALAVMSLNTSTLREDGRVLELAMPISIVADGERTGRVNRAFAMRIRLCEIQRSACSAAYSCNITSRECVDRCGCARPHLT